MKKRLVIISLILLAIIVSAAYAASDSSSSATSSSSSTTSSGTSASTSIDNSALVTVTNVVMNPEVFFPYEEGTITVTLANAGTSAIGLTNPTILSNKVHIVQEDNLGTTTYIGAGSTVSYSFVVTADPPDGTNYALFTVGTVGGGPIHYPIPIIVSSAPLKAVISDSPAPFSLSTPGNVTMSLINCRDGSLQNIEVTAEGIGADVSPQQVFIASLEADNSSEVNFEITPHQDSNVTFYVTYQNGDNDHNVNVTLPVTLGVDKAAAVPILNDVALTTSGSDYDITGDITNAGVSDADGVVVTVGSPAKGTGTYPVYAIGSIASDDSGSFEVTFTSSDLSSVPVVIRWKDANGDDYSLTNTLDLSSSSGSGNATPAGSSRTASGSTMSGAYGGTGRGYGGGGHSSSTGIFGGITSGRGGGISSFYPLIAGSIIVVIGIVLWTKRKWISRKLKKQQ
ncbi:hypothetical protein [Methanoregula sp.]|uniref:hypothetical protein n=1 Tax=Methanoregula sp. TaxID=2052170 RepID=UPI003BB12313